MNKKLALLVTTLAATTGTAGLVGLTGHSVSAGCGATIEVHNRRNSSITVDWEDSESQSGVNTWLGVAGGPWKVLLNNATNTIAPGDIGSRAVVLDFGCSSLHRYRIEVNQGGSSWFVTSPWDTGSFEHIDVF